MTPTPITVPLTSPDVPVAFVLNGTGELEVRSVVATFDGSGAGSAFDAVCSVYTQDDKLISRTKPATSIAAGASAVVTFAPFLRKPAVASAGGGIDAAFIIYKGANTTPGSGLVNVPFTAGSDSLNWGPGGTVAYVTADDTIFGLLPGLWVIGTQIAWELNYNAANDAKVAHAEVQSIDQSEAVAVSDVTTPNVSGSITWRLTQHAVGMSLLPNDPSANRIRVRVERPASTSGRTVLATESVLWGVRVRSSDPP